MATPLADREFIAIDHRFATFFSVSLIWDRILRFTLFALIRLAPDARAHFRSPGPAVVGPVRIKFFFQRHDALDILSTVTRARGYRSRLWLTRDLPVFHVILKSALAHAQ